MISKEFNMTEYTYDLDTFSDLHKEAYGFRPSYTFYEWLEKASPDELQKEWDSLLDSAEYAAQEEKDRADKAHEELVNVLASMQKDHSIDMATAIRWMHDTYQTDGDEGYLEYHVGVRYGTLQKLLKEVA